MQPILFQLARNRNRGRPGAALGWPPFQPSGPLPVASYAISGVTRDSAGAALGGCVVQLFSAPDDRYIGDAISDPTTGAYSFSVGLGTGPYYVVAYKAGSPDVAGTTVNTLVGA